MKASAVAKKLLCFLEQKGWEGRIVGVERLGDLAEAIQTKRDRGLFDPVWAAFSSSWGAIRTFHARRIPGGSPSCWNDASRVWHAEKKCPTAAIKPDQFLLHAEYCLTFHNEKRGEFPEWIGTPAHHCLVGCMRCQIICPENKPHRRRRRFCVKTS
jgi:hypothetical protein